MNYNAFSDIGERITTLIEQELRKNIEEAARTAAEKTIADIMAKWGKVTTTLRTMKPIDKDRIDAQLIVLFPPGEEVT